MPKRFTLIALWALFAAAAVGVGFGASGLVGEPLTSGDSSSSTDVGTTDVTDDTTSVSPTPSDLASSAATVVRGQNSSGGYVSASCIGSLVEVSASPATGWQLHDRTTGQVRSARVRFEPVQDAHGRRVTVFVRCVDGVPTFDRQDRAADSGVDDHGGDRPSGGGDDHGGGGSGGGGSGGGGDDHGGGGGGGGGGGSGGDG